MAPQGGEVIRRWPRPAVGNALYGLLLIPLPLLIVAVGTIVSPPHPTPDMQTDPIEWLALGLLVFEIPCVLIGVFYLRMAREMGFGVRVNPEAVAQGLKAQDETIRMSAAKKLFLVPGPGMPDLAVACLTDPVTVVRYHAIRSLMATKPGRQRLCELLISPDAADTGAKTTVLADLGNITGVGSPYHGWMHRWGTFSSSGEVFQSALMRLKSPELALPILVAAAKYKAMPHVHPKNSAAFDMPNMCCVCGSLYPTAVKQLGHSSSSPGRVTTTTMDVPVCFEHKHEVLRMGVAGAVKFPNPQFVAELLRTGTWSI